MPTARPDNDGSGGRRHRYRAADRRARVAVVGGQAARLGVAADVGPLREPGVEAARGSRPAARCGRRRARRTAASEVAVVDRQLVAVVVDTLSPMPMTTAAPLVCARMPASLRLGRAEQQVVGPLERDVDAGRLDQPPRAARRRPAAAASPTSRIGAAGRSSTEKVSPARGGDVQVRSSRPRPALWCSATSTVRSGAVASRSRSALVDSVSSTTSIRAHRVVRARPAGRRRRSARAPHVHATPRDRSPRRSPRRDSRTRLRAWPSSPSRTRHSTRTPPPASSPIWSRRYDEAVHAGSARAVEKQHAKGKKTARERIEALLDEGSFVELDEFARHRSTNFGMEKNRPFGDGVVTGYGTVDGRPVCVFSQDVTVFGGALGEVYGEKIVKVLDFAMKTGCPVVGINEGGGARIQEGVVVARPVRRHLLPHRAGLRRDPADLADHGRGRRRARLLPRAHRLRRDGRQDLADVHHRPGRRARPSPARTSRSRSSAAPARTTPRAATRTTSASDEDDAINYVKALLSYLP